MRLVAPHRRRPPGEFPPGWDQWIATHQRFVAPAVQPEALAAAIAARGVAPTPPRAAELGRWESFRLLCRGEWGAPAADERPLRRFAWAVAVGWHVLVAVILVWLMYQQYLAPAQPPPLGREDVVQVEFIGEGTPEEVGGGDGRVPVPGSASSEATPMGTAAVRPTATTAAEPSPAVAATAQTMPAASAQPPVAVAQEVAPPVPQQLSQPLVVSEPTSDTDSEFVLPPTMPRLEAPQLVLRDQDSPAPEVSVVELPGRPAPALPAVTARAIPSVVLEQRVPEMVVREIAAALPAAPATAVATPILPASQQPLSARPVQERTIPSPPAEAVAVSPAPAAASASSPSATPANAAPSAPSRAPAAASTSAGKTAPVANAGPKSQAAPGGWSSPRRADDWGDSTREVAGGQKGDPAGIYNADGSVRLATPAGSASPGRPPGTATDEIVNLDRSGTWLKRKPTDYEATTFDRYWRPSESLLEEWVRKSVQTVRIPIPGTNKHVVCTTVLLLVGGGCDISDPNLLDVPATARPAPEVPFKPALQENNGSLPDPVE